MPSKSCLFFIFLLLFTFQTFAKNTNINQTKAELALIEKKMSLLQQTLNHAEDKRGLLTKELGHTEQKINTSLSQLQRTTLTMQSTKNKITNLQAQKNLLNNKLSIQQNLLKEHIRARYAMGEYQPIKWLINQNHLYEINRVLTYYQYIIKSREHLITEMRETQHNLAVNQEKLHRELVKQEELQQQLNRHQQQLTKEKLYSTNTIQSLQKDIQDKQQALKDFQRNKENLSRLLKTLALESAVQTNYSFVYMKKKLPRPVNTDSHRLEKLNQGVVFFANEGQEVDAVSPGTVVFSDWLNGYGLLLIIDHGRGFMTLYAHNKSLLRQKGDVVKQGEEIATVGHSGGIKQNGLYFEIRQRGKAISPLKWLS